MAKQVMLTRALLEKDYEAFVSENDLETDVALVMPDHAGTAYRYLRRRSLNFLLVLRMVRDRYEQNRLCPDCTFSHMKEIQDSLVSLRRHYSSGTLLSAITDLGGMAI